MSQIGLEGHSTRIPMLQKHHGHKRLFQTDELLLKDTKKTWELNIICDPRLDPGPEFYFFFFCYKNISKITENF